MNEKETLAKLERLIREASPAEVIDFVEKLVEKRPELYRPLLDKLKQQRK